MNDSPAARVVALHLCGACRAPMDAPGEAVARAGCGLEGDRHAREGGLRQVLVVDAAVLAAEGLAPGSLRENLTVEGLPVDAVPGGARLRVGASVVLRSTGPCFPCGRMDEIRPGLRGRLRGRRGTLFVVEEGGVVRTGDPVRML